jgi:hypothetical protein
MCEAIERARARVGVSALPTRTHSPSSYSFTIVQRPSYPNIPVPYMVQPSTWGLHHAQQHRWLSARGHLLRLFRKLCSTIPEGISIPQFGPIGI